MEEKRRKKRLANLTTFSQAIYFYTWSTSAPGLGRSGGMWKTPGLRRVGALGSG